MLRIGRMGVQKGRPKFFKGKNTGNISRNLRQKIQRRYRLSGVLGFGK